MSNSKIIMLSGVYLVLGIYSIGYDITDESNFRLSANIANRIQAEQLARTGISFAMTQMGASSGINTYSNVSVDLMNGHVTYSATGNTSQSKITSTGTFNGKTVVIKAVFVYYNNRWRIDRLYIPPSA